jgi:feruloyl esterase
MGPNQNDWFRLFMVPVMAHCGGGGTDQFNTLATLERWREQREPPELIPAARIKERGGIDMTRPLCPYPKRAVYKGTGSIYDAANFTCKGKGD